MMNRTESGVGARAFCVLVAAAYNAGPGRVVSWRLTLPLQLDEWTEAIPFKETRCYVHCFFRNSLKYFRLFVEKGRYRP